LGIRFWSFDIFFFLQNIENEIIKMKDHHLTRFVLTLALVVVGTCVRWLFPFATPIFLVFGIGIGHIWLTYGMTIEKIVFSSATNCDQQQQSIPTTAVSTTEPYLTSTPNYDKLVFKKTDGALLVGKNSYILNHPLSVVSYAVFHKFPNLPCEEVPELISVTLAEEKHITNDLVQKTRIIKSHNIVPGAIGGVLGLSDSTMVLEL
jgi:hypothetical protein